MQQTFFVDEDLKDACQLDAVLTVVDAKHVTQHLDDVKPADVVNEAGVWRARRACLRHDAHTRPRTRTRARTHAHMDGCTDAPVLAHAPGMCPHHLITALQSSRSRLLTRSC
jgi:hypothetical protein